MRKADDLIQRFLDSIGQTEGSVYVGLFRSWQSIVGERIAAHAQPVDLRGHSLVVEADHPGWVQMVMMNRNRIIKELNRRFPELTITGLAVRVVDRPGAARPGKDRPVTAASAPEAGDPGEGRQADGSHHGRSAAGPAEPANDTSAPPDPPPPSRDETEALERIEDDELRDALARLRGDLEAKTDGTDEREEGDERDEA